VYIELFWAKNSDIAVHKRWVESCLSDGDNLRDGKLIKWLRSVASCGAPQYLSAAITKLT
jgi:hypothetical protein